MKTCGQKFEDYSNLVAFALARKERIETEIQKALDFFSKANQEIAAAASGSDPITVSWIPSGDPRDHLPFNWERVQSEVKQYKTEVQEIKKLYDSFDEFDKRIVKFPSNFRLSWT